MSMALGLVACRVEVLAKLRLGVVVRRRLRAPHLQDRSMQA
jgi:hypothetical protein